MKTLIQLLIVALIVNACARASIAAWQYYQFKDAVEQEARFGGQSTTSEMHTRVLQLAEEHGIEMVWEDVSVERAADSSTVVTGAYVAPVPLVPAFYTRQHQFDFRVSARAVRPLTVDDLLK